MCPIKKVLIKGFNSDLFITLMHSSFISLDLVVLQVLFDIPLVQM